MQRIVSNSPANPSDLISTGTPAPPDKHVIHWFRKGLRLHDNPSLREGIQQANTYRCVFIIDPWFAGASNVGINKWRFLLQCLEDLDQSLRRLNSRLFVVRGQPAEALPKLFKEWSITTLTFEEDPEPFGRVRDHNITAMCKDSGVTVVSKVSHTLYSLDDIIELNGGRAPLTYHQFQALVAGMPLPPNAESAVNLDSINGAITPLSKDHDAKFGVPTLEELGFETANVPPASWIGGETEALLRLERHLLRKAWVASYGRPTMTPQLLMASQTGLSPYLRFGCLSPRLFYGRITELYYKIKQERPPLSLHGQLLWREFFYCAATRNPNFDRMLGNPICVQIPWDTNAEALAKWANGQTGYPWIDAIMIQLREEGWVHHLARHAVACFLTRGDLFISWEEGMKVFDELLLDADWSVNAGTWMWLSCSSFFQQFFHCYCPVGFGRKLDPNGDYIRKYIPVLKLMPVEYVHSPWLAPESVQSAANCVVGRHYPRPVVEHARASALNMRRIRQVYTKLAKYRPQVVNGGKESNLLGLLVAQNGNYTAMTLSPPHPTNVIKKINKSNYLYNTTPDSPQIFVKSLIEGFENSGSGNDKILETSEQNATAAPPIVEELKLVVPYQGSLLTDIKRTDENILEIDSNTKKLEQIITVKENYKNIQKEIYPGRNKEAIRNIVEQENSLNDAERNIAKQDTNSNDSYQMSHLMINTEKYNTQYEIVNIDKSEKKSDNTSRIASSPNAVDDEHRQYVKDSSTDEMVEVLRQNYKTGCQTIDDAHNSKDSRYVRSTNSFATTDMNINKTYMSNSNFNVSNMTGERSKTEDNIEFGVSIDDETLNSNVTELSDVTNIVDDNK